MNWNQIKALIRMGFLLLYKDDDKTVYEAEYAQTYQGSGPVLTLTRKNEWGESKRVRVYSWESFHERLKSYRFINTNKNDAE